jgi:hypothetical protein
LGVSAPRAAIHPLVGREQRRPRRTRLGYGITARVYRQVVDGHAPIGRRKRTRVAARPEAKRWAALCGYAFCKVTGAPRQNVPRRRTLLSRKQAGLSLRRGEARAWQHSHTYRQEPVGSRRRKAPNASIIPACAGRALSLGHASPCVPANMPASLMFGFIGVRRRHLCRRTIPVPNTRSSALSSCL